jgi:hypothetical protein
MRKTNDRGNTVQAKDCFAPADYVMVHKDYMKRAEAYREDWIKSADAFNRLFDEKVHLAAVETMLGRLVDACEFHNGTMIFRETIAEAKLLLNGSPAQNEGGK